MGGAPLPSLPNFWVPSGQQTLTTGNKALGSSEAKSPDAGKNGKAEGRGMREAGNEGGGKRAKRCVSLTKLTPDAASNVHTLASRHYSLLSLPGPSQGQTRPDRVWLLAHWAMMTQGSRLSDCDSEDSLDRGQFSAPEQ